MSTPLIFKTISIRNFMSFGNVESTIELDGQGTVTITGENMDKGGSNGSGKTTIINALCYALYNKPFDNISKERLVNTTNAKQNTLMEVRLVFEKDGIEYEIYRARGEEYRIEVRKDGEDITPGKGVYETDDMIQEIIGISYELFTKTIIFSGNAQPFLQLPIHQQRTQIEELFNITMLSEKAKQLKEKIRETEANIKIAEAVVKQQEVAIDLHKKHVREAQHRIDRASVPLVAAAASHPLPVLGRSPHESRRFIAPRRLAGASLANARPATERRRFRATWRSRAETPWRRSLLTRAAPDATGGCHSV